MKLETMKKSELVKLAEEIGLDVIGDWKIDTLRRKIAERQQIVKDAEALEVIPTETMSVRLLANYRPSGHYEILGHEEDGVLHPGEAPHNPWTFAHKISAGTIVTLGKAEAARLVNNLIEEMRTDRDEGGFVTGRRKVKVRIPLAEVYVPMTPVGATGLVDQRAA